MLTPKQRPRKGSIFALHLYPAAPSAPRDLNGDWCRDAANIVPEVPTAREQGRISMGVAKVSPTRNGCVIYMQGRVRTTQAPVATVPSVVNLRRHGS
jgi:hypothetical protein